MNGPVAGSFTYSPALGTVLHAGNDQTLSVSFTPTDSTDYSTATATVPINVARATPSMSWATPSAITYGTALSAAQLDAAVVLDGGRSQWIGHGIVHVLTGPGHDPGRRQQPAPLGDLHARGLDRLHHRFRRRDDRRRAGHSRRGPGPRPRRIAYGTALSGTQLDASTSWTVGGVNGAVAGSFSYTPAAGTIFHPGSQTLSMSFTPTDSADYTSASGSVLLVIDKATPTIAWATPATITYGTPLSAAQLDATADSTVGGVNGSVAGSFTYASEPGTVLQAADQTLSVSFTPTDSTDYTTATDAVTLDVARATPSVSWVDPAEITYGTALSAAQLDATAAWMVDGVTGPVAGSFTYTPAAGTVLPVGSHESLSVVFTPTDSTDYTTASAPQAINVQKAIPSITWAAPDPITYGTALSPAQLDATASVPGTFSYSPAPGSVLHAGSGQTLSLTFTPTDSTDYATTTDAVTIDVGKATPEAVWAALAPIGYGTALSAAQLDAAASWTVAGVNGPVLGSFTYSPAAGTILHLGKAQALRATFTPADPNDYTTASASATIDVDAAAPAIAWPDPGDIRFGTASRPHSSTRAPASPARSPTLPHWARSSRRVPSRRFRSVSFRRTRPITGPLPTP